LVIDTNGIVKKLEARRLSRTQAEGITEALKELDTSGLTTKKGPEGRGPNTPRSRSPGRRLSSSGSWGRFSRRAFSLSRSCSTSSNLASDRCRMAETRSARWRSTRARLRQAPGSPGPRHHGCFRRHTFQLSQSLFVSCQISASVNSGFTNSRGSTRTMRAPVFSLMRRDR
jgi:hypothetical protein